MPNREFTRNMRQVSDLLHSDRKLCGRAPRRSSHPLPWLLGAAAILLALYAVKPAPADLERCMNAPGMSRDTCMFYLVR